MKRVQQNPVFSAPECEGICDLSIYAFVLSKTNSTCCAKQALLGGPPIPLCNVDKCNNQNQCCNLVISIQYIHSKKCYGGNLFFSKYRYLFETLSI